jgi:hypothetical protein
MSGPINTDYFSALKQQINNCTSCAELQMVATQAMSALNAQLAGITAQNATFAALQTLLTAPAANPDAIVTYLSTFIELYLGPQLAAFAKLTAQVAALPIEIAAITEAITSKASSFSECSVSIP